MTLIEVLVAFVVLSVTMAVIMQIFSGGMRNARAADSFSQAVLLAESRLAAAGVDQPLEAGEVDGEVGGYLHWRTNVAPFEDGGILDLQTMPVRLYQVHARVSWSEDGRERQVELATLKLGLRQ